MPAMPGLRSLEEAQALILERVAVLPGERVELEDAHGRVLAEPARSLVDLPPFDSSAMDGFAVRSVDTPGELPVVGEVAAGRPAAGALSPGQATGIATGGVVPSGADAVIPVEYVVNCDNKIHVSTAVRPGANVRPRGGDLRSGEVVVPAGVRLACAQVGALAAAGVADAVCARRPRAAVLTTGTELQTPGEALGHGQVYEANGVMLAAQLRSAGAQVERLAAVEDSEAGQRLALERALGADVLVTSGGVSVGKHDLVRGVEADLGVEEVFWGVAVKPGKPVSFGVRGRTLVFGLPGNPVSSLVSFELFVRPAVLALQGMTDPLPPFRPGLLGRPLRRNPAREELVRARLVYGPAAVGVEPLSGQESHMIARAAQADALALVPRGEGEIEAGSPVRYLPLA